MTRTTWWRLRLALIVLVGLALRVGYAFAYRHHVQLTGDAFYFHYQADLLASGKGFIDPYSLLWKFQTVPGANHPPLWTLVLALAAALGATSFFAQILWGCVVGALAVAAVAVAGREMAGERVGLVAAGISALYPVFIVDDGSLLAETLLVPLVALVVWAFYRLWRRPTLGRAAVLGALCALCALTRSELVLLVLFLAVPAGLFCRRFGVARRAALSAAALVAALCMFAPWWAYTAPRFSHPVVLSDQLGVTLASANCAQTYSGRLMGYWTDDCEKAVHTTSTEDPSARDAQLERAGLRYAEHHAGRVPVVVAVRLGRALGLFKPAQQIDLEWSVLGRPRLPSDIGLGVYYALVALAVPGFVVLRRRGQPIAPLLLIAAEVMLVTAAIFGQTALPRPPRRRARHGRRHDARPRPARTRRPCTAPWCRCDRGTGPCRALVALQRSGGGVASGHRGRAGLPGRFRGGGRRARRDTITAARRGTAAARRGSAAAGRGATGAARRGRCVRPAGQPALANSVRAASTARWKVGYA